MKKIVFPMLLTATLILGACDKAPSPEATKTQVAPQNSTPITANDLSTETKAYQQWVEGQIDLLLSDTEKFVAALNAGNVAEAKRIYPLARMYFERSEPIAESFGDLDPRIDNREADLEKDEVWTGFHRIEKILWTQNTTKGTEQLGKQLINDIKELRAKIPTANVTGELMVQGSVDLLNEVSTSKITGEEEIFSHTDLYDFKANIEGAQKIFEIFTPKLQTKNPALVTELTDKFTVINALLDKHKQGDNGYISYTKLTPQDTKELAEAVNKLGEPLAQMGIVLK
ncbi:MAG: EfeM/EfeO family lipoprotein [Burkholderiales bacterium]|jgi:iron uptake system component EfeO|nr:EfeM/EfeO family lipoprotein [Burkholderiales bacterium]MCE1176697.1 EfeM/EfeO family lipoprotein [Burkholderiales bacterium]